MWYFKYTFDVFSYVSYIIRPYWCLQFIVLMSVFILKYEQITFLPELHCSLVEHFIIHLNYVILLTFHQYLTSAQNSDNDLILWIYSQMNLCGITWWSMFNFSEKLHTVFLNGYVNPLSHWVQRVSFIFYPS